MSTQPERRRDTRARLLSAARELVIEGGFSRASVNEIGARAGMSRGAVGLHFGSKAGILPALLDDLAERCVEISDGVATRKVPMSPADEIDAHWRPWAADPQNSPLLLLLMYEAIGPSPELSGPLQTLRRRIGDYTEQRFMALGSGGAMGPEEAGAATAVVFSALLGLIAQAAIDDTFDLERAYCGLLETFAMRWPATDA
jgi:AcrR family transcriptional regulator